LAVGAEDRGSEAHGRRRQGPLAAGLLARGLDDLLGEAVQGLAGAREPVWQRRQLHARHPPGRRRSAQVAWRVVFLAEISSDPAAGVTIFAALGAGIVSFLSPCVLPLVPGYLSAVTGVSAAELDDAGWRRVLVPSLLFVASFSAIFIALGLTATGL